MADTTYRDGEGEYVPVSYRYERDMDFEPLADRNDNIIFSDESNEHFIYPNADDLINTEDGKKALKQMLDTFFNEQVKRLDVLDSYSKGKNASILEGRRRLDAEKADYRARHNWGKYISSFITGYVIANPVTITTADKQDDETQDKTIQGIGEINQINDINNLNYELAFDASRFGRAFELVYRSEDKEDRTALIDPREAFVIRDLTVERKVIAGVHLPQFDDEVHMTIYTDKQVIQYEPFNKGQITLKEAGRKVNMYDEVPLIEWQNNRFRQGDFETELPLIDLYDSAQSDTANYMSDLNDAMLVIKGDVYADDQDIGDYIAMKNANMLVLETGISHDGKQTNVDAGYIYKQYDVAGTEAYKTRLMNDIYKLSHVPNLDDDRFYSGQSGIALQYKMIGLEQIRATKESFFTKALRRRYQVMGNIRSELNEATLDIGQLVFTFHPNIPQDIWDEIERYINAGGVLSQETMRENTTFTDHISEENRLANENINPNATDAEREFLLRGRELDAESPETV